MTTTSTETVFETADALPAECRPAVRNLVLACADTKLLLGYHYGEWTFGTPELEAAVASCSLAQGEMGHVRLLHGCLQKQFGDDPDALIEKRAPAAWANVPFLDHAVPDWPAFVAVNWLVDLALTRLLYALRGSAFLPLRMSLEKMIDEERYHIHHGQGWFRTLARRSDDTTTAFVSHARAALASLAEWFGPDDDAEDAALVAAGCKGESNRQVFDAFVGDVTAAAKPFGLDFAVQQPSGWDRWTPARRRIAGGGPDEEILYHLRGAKNEVFKLA